MVENNIMNSTAKHNWENSKNCNQQHKKLHARKSKINNFEFNFHALGH